MKMDSKFEDEMMDEISVKGKHKEAFHNIMTMDSVAETLADDFGDEISDSKKYLHMAKIADKAGDQKDCHYLMEMAKDEYTHAYFIHDFMKEHHMDIPKEQCEEFECLTETMKEFFRK